MAVRERPITTVFTEVVTELTALVQTEFRLARAELNEKLDRIANSGMAIGAGAICALAGLFVLLLAIAEWLAVAGLPREWGLLLVGGLVLVIGAVLLMRGVNSLRGSALVPQRTVHQVRQDISVAREQVR
jgi:hypothetical protein